MSSPLACPPPGGDPAPRGTARSGPASCGSAPRGSAPRGSAPRGSAPSGSAPSDPAPIDASLFRQVFRRHAAPVAVITTGGAAPVGFTATSLVPLAADPPLVSFNIARGSSSWPAVERAEHLGVHLLAADQQEVATVFATSGIDRFARVTGWRRGPYGLPVLDGTLAWLAIRPRTRVDAGDHALVIADVVRAEYAEGSPLLYHHGRYTSTAQGGEA